MELLLQLGTEVEIILFIKAVSTGKIDGEEEGQKQAVKREAGNSPEDKEKLHVQWVAKVGVETEGP